MTAHRLPIRVYYEDTDAGGIVYHASYLRFGERGRTEMLRSMGFEHAKLFKEKGIAFAVVSMQINYRRPALLDDLLEIQTSVAKLGGASLELRQDIYRGDELICEIKPVLVCIDSSMKAVKLPLDLRTLLKDADLP